MGDVLAESDNTGLSTGPHLHFGLKPVAKGEQSWIWFNVEQKNGYLGAIDPLPYFNGLYAYDAFTLRDILKQPISSAQKVLKLLQLFRGA